MDDPISRAVAVRIISDMHGLCRDDVLRECIQAIKELPAVDAVPVKLGRWIHCKGKSHIWYCSNCGEKVNYNNAHKVYTKSMRPIQEVNLYCRSCGARMDGEADG